MIATPHVLNEAPSEAPTHAPTEWPTGGARGDELHFMLNTVTTWLAQASSSAACALRAHSGCGHGAGDGAIHSRYPDAALLDQRGLQNLACTDRI